MSEREPNQENDVEYDILDPFKINAQRAAASTAPNLKKYFGQFEIAQTRGESAFVWDEGSKSGAMVAEGLGTKNLVADAMYEVTGRTYYDAIAQDTVAAIVNDLITVGAMPKVIMPHWAVAEGDWAVRNPQKAQDLIDGWERACNLAGAVWGGGETPQLKDILQPGTIELSGSASGEVNPPQHLAYGDKLQPGDKIIYLPSSGIHANGLTEARKIAQFLPDGYLSQLADGISYGETLLIPTPIYVDAIRSLLNAPVDIHYMVNITGEGWRKLMRADRDDLRYVISLPPQPQPVFAFIQEQAEYDDYKMYGTFNMGAGFAVYVAGNDLRLALGSLQDAGYAARLAGHVEEGPRQVIIEPKGIVFESDTLKIR
jgi:phosphoribosylformylglycinamidine cyclo-ligase